MQTVTTLAATSTVATAAVGLCFARPNTKNTPRAAPEPRPTTSPEKIDMPGSLPSATPEVHHTLRTEFRRDGLERLPDHTNLPNERLMLGCMPTPKSADSRPRSRRSLLPHSSTNPTSTASSTPQSRSSNRLVKKSSPRSGSHGSPLPSALGKRDSVSRPYTSHQRDYYHHITPQATSTNTFSSDPDQSVAHLDKSPLHFFTPRVPRAERLLADRDLSSFSGPPFIRRISPDGRSPILVAGGVISGTDVEIDETLDELALSEVSSHKSTRPVTPSGSFSFSSPIPVLSPFDSSHDRAPRRSFSFTKLFTSRSPSLRHTSDGTRSLSSLRRRTSRRIFSAPGQNSGRLGDEERPTKKRGIDSMHTSSTGFSSAQPSSPGSRPTTSDSRPPTSGSRPSRLSATLSDLTSSQIGSDTGTGVFSSADEDDLDFQSDTVYDSMRTGMTRNSSGFRGPGLETLFDKPDEYASDSDASEVPQLSHNANSPGTVVPRGRRGPSEDDETSSTPARTIVGPRHDSRAPSSRTLDLTDRSPSSPGARPTLSLGKLSFSRPGSLEDISWSDDENWDKIQDSPTPHHANKTLAWLDESTPRHIKLSTLPTMEHTPREFETKINPFDWSEHPPQNANSSPPRPRTEHGKKATEARGSRPAGRAPSGFHARSTSVPVVPDVKTKVTNKFGTWGIGSKGVSEDWDDDFAFELPKPDGSESSEGGSRPNTATTMHVPLAIREAQVNVVSNISLVREWGLLIEELKELRIRATTLGVAVKEHAATFDEVDAMIELADLDHEELPEVAAQSKSQSPSLVASPPRFSFDEIDEKTPTGSGTPLRRVSKADEDDMFGTPPATMTPQRSPASHSHAVQGLMNRSRKNSEAVALSVIEELHRRRGAADPKINKGPKMEFDTATLKNIVPYVNGLMRQFKVILRDAEGLATTPRRSRRSEDPAFSQAFIEPGSPASPSRRRGNRCSHDNDNEDDDNNKNDDDKVADLSADLKGKLQLM